jgi:hypothetical protein
MKIAEFRVPVFILIVFLLILGGSYRGCETEDVVIGIDCNDCYGYVPDSADLIIYLTIDGMNPRVPIIVYHGRLEEGHVDWMDTATTAEYHLYSALDVYYTVEVTYRSGDKTILAYDGDRMYSYDAGDQCGAPCYIIKGGIFDNRLMK